MSDNTDYDYAHVMDPSTEDLIYGIDLQEGMVVLVEKHNNFDKPSDLEREERYDGEHDRLRKSLNEEARWCTVTKLRQDRRWETTEEDYGFSNKSREIAPLTRFIGVYEDGTKVTRTYDSTYGWFVKLDSIPKPVEEQQERIEIICDENCEDCRASMERAADEARWGEEAQREADEALATLRQKLSGIDPRY